MTVAKIQNGFIIAKYFFLNCRAKKKALFHMRWKITPKANKVTDLKRNSLCSGKCQDQKAKKCSILPSACRRKARTVNVCLSGGEWRPFAGTNKAEVELHPRPPCQLLQPQTLLMFLVSQQKTCCLTVLHRSHVTSTPLAVLSDTLNLHIEGWQ